MKRLFGIAAVLLATLLAAGPAGADCEEGRRLFESAMQQRNPADRIPHLERASRVCDDFAVWLELGGAYLSAGDTAEARKAFGEARHWAGNDVAIAQANFGLARAAEGEGDNATALGYYKAALSRRDVLPAALVASVQDRYRELVIPQTKSIMGSDQIKGQLAKLERNFQVVPSLDLFINFPEDSDRLVGKGRDQANELGRALTDPKFAGKPFRVVGHTNSRGDYGYNQDLSERRARTVRDYLIANFGINPGLLSTEGKGESALRIWPEQNEADYAINRRVEILIER